MAEITPEAKKMIEENPVAFATADGNKPNVIYVAAVKVVSPDKIIITDNYMKQTKENLEKNNNVCIAVCDKNGKGCKLVGSAKYFATGKWKEFVEKIPENRGLPAKGAILVTVSKPIILK